MKTPNEFGYLLRCFWDRSELVAKTQQEWINSAVMLTNNKQKQIIKHFLDDFMHQDVSDDEIMKI